MNRNSYIYQIMRRCAAVLGHANTQALFGPKSWVPQTDYNPVDPNKQDLPELDTSPEAVEFREKEARNSLLVLWRATRILEIRIGCI